MSNDLAPYQGTNLTVRDSKRTNRAISRHQAGGQVRVAAVDAETDVAMAKVEGLTMVTANAMSAVARLAQAQTQLEQQVPEASGRLAYVADTHLLCVGDMLRDLRHDLRRR